MTRWICLGFGLGLLRPAPGTWGSLGALIIGLLIDRAFGFPGLLVATLLVTLLAYFTLRAELGTGHEDPSEFVIDEVAGQWLALLFPSAAFWWHGLSDWAIVAYPGWIAAFLFFRLFDIWKPWLVGRADRMGGPWGVLSDDLWAGVFAGVATMLAAGFAHGVLM